MNTLNYILLLIVILLFFISLRTRKNVTEVKKIKIENSDILLKMIKKLANCMSNQVLVIEYNNIKIMELERYQKNNLWGIKILYDLTNKKNEFAIVKSWLNERNIVFEHKIFDKNIEGLVINCINIISLPIEFFNFIIKNIEKVSSKNNTYCYFLRSSIEH